MKDSKQITKMDNWQTKAFIIGAVSGAVIGLAGAYLFVQRAEDSENAPGVTSGDVVRLGLLVLGLLRSVAELGG